MTYVRAVRGRNIKDVMGYEEERICFRGKLCYNNLMKREFTAVYQKRGKWFLAWVEEIPGVNTQGRTQKEAKENLKEAVELILETNRALTSGRAAGTKRELLRVVVPS